METSSESKDQHTQNNKELYIYENINDISINDRIEIVKHIYNSKFRNKLLEKGNGVQIKFTDLDDTMIDDIYKLINKKSKENMLDI